MKAVKKTQLGYKKAHGNKIDKKMKRLRAIACDVLQLKIDRAIANGRTDTSIPASRLTLPARRAIVRPLRIQGFDVVYSHKKISVDWRNV